jgi:hypothetical protein
MAILLASAQQNIFSAPAIEFTCADELAKCEGGYIQLIIAAGSRASEFIARPCSQHSSSLSKPVRVRWRGWRRIFQNWKLLRDSCFWAIRQIAEASQALLHLLGPIKFLAKKGRLFR